jgi:hypothetical protein
MCNCLYSKIQELEKQAEADRAEIAELMGHKCVILDLKVVLLIIGILSISVLLVLLLHLLNIIK